MAPRALLLAAALAAAVVVVDAACPNQCSGHGRCSEFDKCVCYRSAGSSTPSRYGYTGADCSLRTCPTGKGYDLVKNDKASLTPLVLRPAAATSVPRLRAVFLLANRSTTFAEQHRDAGFTIKVMSVNSDPTEYGSFTWKADEDEYYQPEQAIATAMSESVARPLSKVNADGTPDAGSQSGVFVYWDENGSGDMAAFPAGVTEGDIYSFTLQWNNNQDFDEADSNSAHQNMECSGRGTCNYGSGKCACLPGYTGEACQRTLCPSSCSGHGTCQSEARFVSTANIARNKYEGGWDGEVQYGCKCDLGYRGPDCSMIECPSGADPMGGDGGSAGMDCSGRGTCNYGTGVCGCYKGFTGERCESQSTFV